jgi:hypothetical protein
VYSHWSAQRYCPHKIRRHVRVCFQSGNGTNHIILLLLLVFDFTDNSLFNHVENNEDLELEQALEDTQPILSLQTADDVDLEMDMDLLEHVEPVEVFDEGDETDSSHNDEMDPFI